MAIITFFILIYIEICYSLGHFNLTPDGCKRESIQIATVGSIDHSGGDYSRYLSEYRWRCRLPAGLPHADVYKPLQHRRLSGRKRILPAAAKYWLVHARL